MLCEKLKPVNLNVKQVQNGAATLIGKTTIEKLGRRTNLKPICIRNLQKMKISAIKLFEKNRVLTN